MVVWRFRQTTRCASCGGALPTMCVSVDGIYFFCNRHAGLAARYYASGRHPVTGKSLNNPSSTPIEKKEKTKKVDEK